MSNIESAVVTGAFSYTGRYVARRLLDEGARVKTLTARPAGQDPFGGRVEAAPLDFSDRDGLREAMRGADVFFNTYWVRFGRGQTTFDQAVANSRTLFEAAADAGVGRIVHVSITNASAESRLPYFNGKGRVEAALREVGVPYAVVRPTLVFSAEDVLLNNMAWALRRFPVLPVFGDGRYPVQPVFVEDIANLAVDAASRTGSSVTDAVGPETFGFESLLRLLAESIGARCRFVHTPPSLGLAMTKLVGMLVRDVVLIRDEVDGLMDGLLKSDSPPTCETKLSDWLRDNAAGLGRRYVSELERNYDRPA